MISVGSVRYKGDIKRTYEVIADDGCNDYKLENVPAYSASVQGLREGLTSVMRGYTGRMVIITLQIR